MELIPLVGEKSVQRGEKIGAHLEKSQRGINPEKKKGVSLSKQEKKFKKKHSPRQ